MPKYEVGDRVVYHKPKMSGRPGRRAEDVHPSPHGEDYSYVVDKFWTVSAVHDDGTLDVITRTGKVHRLREEDPLLRKASLIQKARFKDRFPDLKAAGAGAEQGVGKPGPCRTP